MSLFLDLIRQLLEYLGIPGHHLDQIWENYMNRFIMFHTLESRLLPILLRGINLQVLQGWERKEYGYTRSIVRIIGTVLPLNPCQRPCFQNVQSGVVREPKEYTTLCRPDIPSLADIPWVTDNDVLSYTTFRHEFIANKSGECTKIPCLVPTILPSNAQSGHGSNSLIDPTSQKIAALEDELMQLRAQIAAIVAMQDTKSIQSCSETLCSFGSPAIALPLPSLASTPISAQQIYFAPILPPPPPPPPPPFPSVKPDPYKTTIDLIKQHKEAQKQGKEDMGTIVKDNTNRLPSMMDVLKGINTIRLRAVERSPGGTPLTQKNKKRRSLNDPASIIAHALQKKFAHRHTDDSFEKENISQENCAFSSPETPQFGRHLLKPVEKRTKKKVMQRLKFRMYGGWTVF